VAVLALAAPHANEYVYRYAPQLVPRTGGILPLEPDALPATSILMVGDVMLDRDIYTTAQKNKNYAYPFELIDPFLKNFDAVIANLEGPITDATPVATPGGVLRFTFSKNFVPEIAKRFSAVSLANNHMLDFGKDGLTQTREALDAAGVSYFGDPQENEGVYTTTMRRGGITIGLVGYHNLRAQDTQGVIRAIQAVRDTTDYVIVYPHWGIEYRLEESKAQQQEARAFIDAGADLIMGSHPHVVEPLEIYNKGVIFYSLGNFVFDQYWSQETMRGMAVGLSLEKTKTGISQIFTLYPLLINGTGQPERADAKNAADILGRIAETATVPDAVREHIENGTITLAP